MAVEDEAPNETDTPPVRQFLKVLKQGIGSEAVAHRIKENDILVAIDGELFLGDSETLKAAFEDYDPTMPDDVAWLVKFWRDGVFFNQCFHTPLRAKFDFVTPEDLQDLSGDVLRHRIIESYEAESDGITTDDVIAKILAQVAVP